MRWPENASAARCVTCSNSIWPRRVVCLTRCPSRASGYATSGADVTTTSASFQSSEKSKTA